MRKSRTVLVALMFITVQFIGIAYGSGGGGGGGATEWTQKMNNAELVEAIRKANEQIRNQIEQITNQVSMITNQITMIKDMATNTLGLPSQMYGEVMGLVNNVKNVMDNSKGIAYTLGDLDGIFKQRFRSYGEMSGIKNQIDLEREYAKIQDTQRETIRSSMKAIGVMYDQYTTDAELLTQLQKKAETAEGRNQILQAGNQLTSFTAQELLKLRELSIMQINNYNTELESERAKEDLRNKERELMLERVPLNREMIKNMDEDPWSARWKK